MNADVIRAAPATDPSGFEPLLPRQEHVPQLLELANELQERCWRLSGKSVPGVRQRLTRLLRGMNSYYTNKIEGQHTLPADIEDALNNHYSADPKRARGQRLAIAHLRTEEWAESQLDTQSADGWKATFSTEFVCRLHEHLYQQLPEEDRVTETGAPICEGLLREQNVKVGQHVAPDYKAMPRFLERWKTFYTRLPRGEQALLGVACAHHRLAWIHPFMDGNGRVARLQSHLALTAMGLTGGYWSPMRGLARRQEDYYARLVDADEPRRGDFDGRGALTEEGLVGFAKFFLEVCIDQVEFMDKMLNLHEFKDRLEALLSFEIHAGKLPDLRMDVIRPLHYIILNGPIERGAFKAMTGLKTRTAERALKALLDYKLLLSDTPKGEVYFGVPQDSLRFLFPNLWPEAEAAIERRRGE
mgnify:CR=1 FL=1